MAADETPAPPAPAAVPTEPLATGRPGRRARIGRPLAALAGGVLLALSLPPWGWWPLAFIGIALLDRSLDGASFWSRFRRAWLAGFGLLAPSTVWMLVFTPPGYVIQVVAYSGFLGLAVAATPPSRWRWLALPGAWVLFEALKDRWPFGGVPLSELGVGQVAGPLAGAARVGGVLLIAMLTVALGVALSAALRRAWLPAAAALCAVVVVVGLSALAPRGENTGETVTVAYVQGGGEQGTSDADTDDREVFLTHIRASEAVPVGTDLTVWPENVVNVDGPIDDEPEAAELADLARRKETTLVAGVVEGAGPGAFRNAAVVFGPNGEIVARYDKVRRVPFGEFVPARELLEKVAGGALPAKDAIAGEETNTLDTPAGRIGVVISWEVFFADRGRDAIGGRGEVGELLINPTNGSSYSGTLVQSQQVAFSRLRAIETGRWTVQAAPTGFSAFVTDEGRVRNRSAVSEQRVEVREVPLRTGRTLYLRWGVWPTLVLAVALMVASHLLPRLAERRTSRGPSAQPRSTARGPRP
ncbi:apolipoprotein N-acyltransferase [Iamia sp.]|uniref:apolipoprotein N-acyltransferase n=1 Tax=Iamia sp. TaxID=2722710 RepID=UPI002C095A20|nr:apolipoprotein N-acyltransferase [Iamia sp.]HXH56827.1 apolipoprotein N-acyltransferase [Iamia sp.]